MPVTELTADISSMAGSSPKSIAAIMTLRLYEKYFDYLAHNVGGGIDIDGLTAAILISCPEKTLREKMWSDYVTEKEKTGDVKTASVHAVGDWWTYMVDAMGLQEVTSGGW